ncbi:hypothetical protein PtB15_3B531 [Puccinia triticina]|nr:hypothetical protein PtB15_3B531 [Puccinia triticina]
MPSRSTLVSPRRLRLTSACRKQINQSAAKSVSQSQEAFISKLLDDCEHGIWKPSDQLRVVDLRPILKHYGVNISQAKRKTLVDNYNILVAKKQGLVKARVLPGTSTQDDDDNSSTDVPLASLPQPKRADSRDLPTLGHVEARVLPGTPNQDDDNDSSTDVPLASLPQPKRVDSRDLPTLGHVKAGPRITHSPFTDALNTIADSVLGKPNPERSIKQPRIMSDDVEPVFNTHNRTDQSSNDAHPKSPKQDFNHHNDNTSSDGEPLATLNKRPPAPNSNCNNHFSSGKDLSPASLADCTSSSSTDHKSQEPKVKLDKGKQRVQNTFNAKEGLNAVGLGSTNACDALPASHHSTQLSAFNHVGETSIRTVGTLPTTNVFSEFLNTPCVSVLGKRKWSTAGLNLPAVNEILLEQLKSILDNYGVGMLFIFRIPINKGSTAATLTSFYHSDGVIATKSQHNSKLL